MSSRAWVVDTIAGIIPGSKSERVQTAEMIVDRLMEEGVLHLGYGDADIDKVVNSFTDAFGTTKVTRQDRWAASRLVKRHDTKAVVGIVRLLAENSTAKYAPVVGSIAQLETKWVAVLNFLRNTSKDNEEIQI